MVSQHSAQARAKIQRWKSNFLDLSNRNNQLNFNPHSKSFIEVISPDCATLFKMLIVMDQTCIFPPVFKTKAKRKRKAKKTSKPAPFEAIEEPKITQEVKDAHFEALEKAKKDARLTEVLTKLTDNVLESRVKKILRKTQEAEEERGINILYITFGLLQWKEKGDPTMKHSPLLFVPCKLSLKPLSIDLLDDEVIVNPALREKLLGERITLPKFGYEFDSRAFEKYLETVEDAISIEPSWILERRAFIGTFSFTKAPLFEDLDDHEELILSHPIIRAIAEEKGFEEDQRNLPDSSTFGDASSAEESYAILDCDSSQMEAVAYAKSGASLVIQGPPGTGKSQCIANIIAECLAVNKKVLFVAQKKAALDVVKKRLEKCGIGEYCLQVHSQNANKKEVLKQIDDSMNLSQFSDSVRHAKYKELNLIRTKLNEYVELVNQKYGILQYSIYDILGKLLQLENIPLVECNIRDPKIISESDFIQIKDIFHQLENFRSTLENYDNNPWRYSRIVSPLILSSELHLVLKKLLISFKENNMHLEQQMMLIDQKYPQHFMKNLQNLSQWEKVFSVGKYWSEVIKKIYPYWNSLDHDYHKLREYFDLESVINYPEMDFQSLRQLKLAYETSIPEKKTFHDYISSKLSEYMQKVEVLYDKISVFNMKSKLRPIFNDSDLFRIQKFFTNYNREALLLDVDGLVARFTIDYTSWIKKHGASYKADKVAILNCLKIPNPKANVIGHLNMIKSFQDEFGRPYSSSPESLEQLIDSFGEIYEIWQSFRELEDYLHPIFSLEFMKSDISQELWDKNTSFAEQWYNNLPYLNDWFEVQVRAHHLHDLGMLTLFKKIRNKKWYFSADYDANQKKPILYEHIFEKLFYTIWFEDIRDSLPPIANFKRKFHEKEIGQFRKKDEETLSLNQLRLQKKLFDLRPQSDLDIPQELISEMGFIKRELKKKRNVKPLRQVFTQARNLITLYKPCFLMSPLSIANYLAVEEYAQYFDIVVFDEASQVTPEDAIGAIMRGKSLVVVGDSEQLPPTNFFTAQSSSDEFFEDPDLDVDVQSMESLLDEATGIGFREKMLKFHYRSKKEGLIAFSNRNYYNGRLFSFPDIGTGKHTNNSLTSPDTTVSSTENVVSDQNMTVGSKKSEYLENYAEIVALPAISFYHIQNGRKLKGKNKVEAQAVAEAIIRHYRSNQQFNTHYSLGVVAFSQAQQDTIQNAIDHLIKDDSSLENLIYASENEPLFIKNLESVQGDERDFIFFSIGYAKDSKGNMSLNFGPLNRSGGYRRLNVAITRARYHVKLFSSFLPGEIPYDRIKARGLRDLVNYMKYARTGQLPGKKKASAQMQAEFQDTFEADVERAIENLGYAVELKVGTSDFRIDLAVVDPEDPAKYILGLELDGGSYQDAENARDRDRIRYNVLKMLGWNMFHVWSLEWYADKNKVLKRIVKAIKQA
jgi:very-short-patch-repair endonuclease